jgi:hypothetical protein
MECHLAPFLCHSYVTPCLMLAVRPYCHPNNTGFEQGPVRCADHISRFRRRTEFVPSQFPNKLTQKRKAAKKCLVEGADRSSYPSRYFFATPRLCVRFFYPTQARRRVAVGTSWRHGNATFTALERIREVWIEDCATGLWTMAIRSSMISPTMWSCALCGRSRSDAAHCIDPAARAAINHVRPIALQGARPCPKRRPSSIAA